MIMALIPHSPTLAIVWQPVAPPLQIGLGAFVLCGLAVFAYVRVMSSHRTASTVLLVMRLCVIGAVATLLMGPSREEPQADSSQQSQLTILLDTSESMLTEDCGSDPRIEYVARQVLDRQQLSELQEDFQVNLLGFDERVHPVPLTRLQQAPTEPSGHFSPYPQYSGRQLRPLYEKAAVAVLVSIGTCPN